MGSTVVHRVQDVWVTYNGKKVHLGDTMSRIDIRNHDTLLRWTAQRWCSALSATTD